MLLFTPGPVSVKREILEAGSIPPIFHRSRNFEELFKSCSSKTLKIFGAANDYLPLIITGSGTAANELVISSIFEKRNKILILSNGDFGERLASIALIHGKNVQHLQLAWGRTFDVNQVGNLLKKEKFQALAMVALETSTGMINPVHEIGQLCAKHKVTFFVDAVSAIGAENISVKDDHIDACVTVPNKGLEGLPGLGLISIKKEVLYKVQEGISPDSCYLNLFRYAEFALKNQTPTTPALSLFKSLNVALDLFLIEGLKNRIKRYATLSRLVRFKAKELGFSELIVEDRHKSNAITTLCLPSKVDVVALHKYLALRGIVVWYYYNNEKFEDKDILQLSVMGEITRKDIEKLFGLISKFVTIQQIK